MIFNIKQIFIIILSLTALNISCSQTDMFGKINEVYVTYDANGGTGSVPADSRAYAEGDTVTVQAKPSGLVNSSSFICWNTRADGLGINYIAGNTFTLSSKDAVLYAKWNNGAYDLFNPDDAGNPNHTGPGGGWIFYVNPNAAVDGWTYLEAAPVDQSSTEPWSNIIFLFVNGVSSLPSGIGTGQANTTAIINQAGHTNSAALLCDNYSNNGCTDWFLPSADELYLMRINLSDLGVGGFAANYYWSSSEYTSVTSAQRLFFNPIGNMTYTNKGDTVTRTRAVRAF